MRKCDVCQEEQNARERPVRAFFGEERTLDAHSVCFDHLILRYQLERSATQTGVGDELQAMMCPPGYARCLNCGAVTKHTTQDDQSLHHCEPCAERIATKGL